MSKIKKQNCDAQFAVEISSQESSGLNKGDHEQHDHGEPHEYQEPTYLPHYFVLYNLELVHERIADLELGLQYTFEDICGKDYWKGLTKHEQYLTFSCMTFLIKYESLPLEIKGYSSNKGHLYGLNARLISTETPLSKGLIVERYFDNIYADLENLEPITIN